MERKRSAIIDVSERVGNFRTAVRTFMREINAKRSYDKNSESAELREKEIREDFVKVASECEQLFQVLARSHPEKLSDKDLFSLWEDLYCLDRIRKLPGGGTTQNLEMLKIVSTDRIRAFFNNYQLYTIGVDERPVGKKDGTAVMVVDVILDDEGSQKLTKANLPREYISVHHENGGIFLTIQAEDIPKLLAIGSRKDELTVGQEKIRQTVSETVSKMN